MTIDVGIALDDHERLRAERLLAEEGMAAEIRFIDVLKMVIVPTLDDGRRVLLWTAVYGSTASTTRCSTSRNS